MRLCLISALLLLTTPLPAQPGPQSATPRDTTRKVHVVPGLRHGPSAFPLTNYAETRPLTTGQLDFKHYHTSAEIEMWMKKWAEQYPDLVDLYQVGQSFGGRTLWQMTHTNRKTGKHTDKPAALFDGGRHSGEISGTESAFYLMWYLLATAVWSPDGEPLVSVDLSSLFGPAPQ